MFIVVVVSVVRISVVSFGISIGFSNSIGVVGYQAMILECVKGHGGTSLAIQVFGSSLMTCANVHSSINCITAVSISSNTNALISKVKSNTCFTSSTMMMIMCWIVTTTRCDCASEIACC